MPYKIDFPTENQRDYAESEIDNSSDFATFPQGETSLLIYGCEESDAKSFAEILGGTIDDDFDPLNN